MVRVLHLRSVQPDFQTERLTAALQRHGGKGVSITTQTIGRGGDHRSRLLAILRLCRPRAQQFDAYHAWDAESFSAAAWAGLEPLVYSPARFLPKAELRWAVAYANPREVTLACASEEEQARYLAAGLLDDACSVVPPGVDFTLIKTNRNAAIRAALGFADDDYVLLAPGESTRELGHRDALWTGSILHVLNPQFRVLLWGRGPMVPMLHRLAQKLNQPRLLTLGPGLSFEELMSAADAVVHVPAGPAPMLPLGMCMAAGLPIVTPESPWTEDLLLDRDSAVIVPGRSPRMLAQAVLELRNDAVLRAQISAGAAREARDAFRMKSFVNDYLRIYRG